MANRNILKERTVYYDRRTILKKQRILKKKYHVIKL